MLLARRGSGFPFKSPLFGLTGFAGLSSDSEFDVYTKPIEPMAGEHEMTMTTVWVLTVQ